MDRTLVAGVGNVFLGDDGFGVEALHRLARARPGRDADGTDFVDVGIRGLDLAYRMLDGYRTVIIVDALARGAQPGSVCVLDATAEIGGAGVRTGVVDGHGMDPAAVLALAGSLHAGMGGTLPERVYVVGCEPERVEESMGLSPAVTAALPVAVDAVAGLLRTADATDTTDTVTDTDTPTDSM